MNLQHINIKFYLEHPETVNLADFDTVFNSWIQGQRLEELLIDVADYLHVHHGPGILLIGHEADYSLDNRAGRLGLLYNRKEQLDGTNQEKTCAGCSCCFDRRSNPGKGKWLEVHWRRSAGDRQ